MTKPSQDFSARNLGWMRRYRKQFYLTADDGSRPDSDADWTAFLASLEQKVSFAGMSFSRLRSVRLVRAQKQRLVLTSRSLDEALVLRKVNDNLRRSYGIRGNNRSDAITTVLQALAENTPKAIYRVDIKSCFESISRSDVMQQLRSDGIITYQTIALIEQLFRTSSKLAPKVPRRGLPRGLILSGTLAEIRLQAMDKMLREIPGVYLLLRYVDDFVVFSSADASSLVSSVGKVLENLGLRANKDKTESFAVGCKCSSTCPHGVQCPCRQKCACLVNDPTAAYRMEYLGYEVRFSPFNKSGDLNELVIFLSRNKLNKLKTRMTLAVKSYISRGDPSLLRDRLKYLTGNQMMLSSKGKRGLLSGLAYTHPKYSFLHGGGESLAELDGYLHRVVRFGFTRRPAALPDRAEILSITFRSGFEHRRRTKFSAPRVAEIVRCWTNV